MLTSPLFLQSLTQGLTHTMCSVNAHRAQIASSLHTLPGPASSSRFQLIMKLPLLKKTQITLLGWCQVPPGFRGNGEAPPRTASSCLNGSVPSPQPSRLQPSLPASPTPPQRVKVNQRPYQGFVSTSQAPSFSFFPHGLLKIEDFCLFNNPEKKKRKKNKN